MQVKFSGQLLDGTMSLLAVGQPRPDNTIASAKIRTLKIEEMDEMNFVLTIGLKGWFLKSFQEIIKMYLQNLFHSVTEIWKYYHCMEKV